MNTNLLKTFFVALLLITATGASAHDFEVDGIYYNITDATAKTVEVKYKGGSDSEYYNEYTGSVVIPSMVTYNNAAYSVTSIRDYAFYDCSGLTSITIPNSVTSIGEWAFSNCTGLTGITIPNSVTSIGDDAFVYCTGLTSITIPNSVTSIESGTFFGCRGLTGITIPNSVTSIGESAFEGCTSLTSITIPNSVTSIGAWAFGGCTGLTGITIPNSVTSIGNYAFYGCTGLTSITIPNSVTSIGYDAFEDCTSLKTVYNFSSLELTKGSTNNGYVAYYADKVINAPNGSVEGDYVFDIVDGVNTLCGYIGNGGEITLPADYKGENYVIGADVFKNNTALIGVTIGNSVTSIGYEAFYDCTGLTSITIPNSVTSIGAWAFGGCSGLTSITIPNSVTSIGGSAFQGCTGLTGVTIGNSVTSIGDYAFEDCTSLKTVYNFSSLELTKGSTNNGYVAYYADKVINAPNGSVEGDYVFDIVDGVNTLCEYIGNGGEITLPADYKGENYVIGADVFKNNTALIGVTIGNSVTSIGAWAFGGCTGLTSITIPNSVTSIGNYAFYACRDLKVIYALSETPVELLYNVFSNYAKSAITLYVPIGAKEAYATAWGFDNIVETDFTGVDGVTADEQTGGNELYYDLSGRAVKNPANGIYIYKGKKVLVQ